MIVFIDLEASSLTHGGYPIEVGWAIVDGITSIVSVESHLIKPTKTWKEDGHWDEVSAQVHHIQREKLDCDGEPVGDVCQRLVEKLAGVHCYTDNMQLDGRWLGILFGAWTGRDMIIPQDGLRMRLHDFWSLMSAPLFSDEALLHADAKLSGIPVPHRAGADAERLARRYVLARSYDEKHHNLRGRSRDDLT